MNRRDDVQFASSLTCVHLIHAVEEVIWSARDAVAAHTQAAVCALIPGVVGPAGNTQEVNLGYEVCSQSWTSPFSIKLKEMKSSFVSAELLMTLMTFAELYFKTELRQSN